MTSRDDQEIDVCWSEIRNDWWLIAMTIDWWCSEDASCGQNSLRTGTQQIGELGFPWKLVPSVYENFGAGIVEHGIRKDGLISN